ncbi:MAG TPA: FlgD immunoglobulin-like domain containing protein, partial [Frankiaceae bacterium]|nr:FlgD immunoglobulin-like domain containing protein [Frankiaceae bacterium]
APDGDGGVLVAWEDLRGGVGDDIYAQRVKNNGVLLWNPAGVAVCAATGFQEYPQIVSDGGGGAVVVWTDGRVGEDDVYALRVGAAGTALWATDGVPVTTNRANLDEMAAAGDGAGGVVASFGGLHDGADGIYAQRVERFGQIGSPEPAITGIGDVAGDQGGQVVVEWTASYLDADPGFEIGEYSVWRQVPASLAVAPALAATAPEVVAGRRALRATAEGVQTVYWEFVGSQPARGRAGYSFVATTTTDSMPGSNPLTRFMVSAEMTGGVPYWDSAADSGYSVDDLAPPTPAPFTGQYAGGTTTLQWGTSPAPDFAAFRLYRGHEAGFVPAAENLVATTTAGGYSDAAGSPYFYKVCAVDTHGNASPFASLQPGGTVDAPGAALPRELTLSAPAPNPLRGSATLHLALPRAAKVAVAVFDQQGRRVRILLAGEQPAGDHAVCWDGRDAAGRLVPNGIYFVRCDVEGRALTRRIATLR